MPGDGQEGKANRNVLAPAGRSRRPRGWTGARPLSFSGCLVLAPSGGGDKGAPQRRGHRDKAQESEKLKEQQGRRRVGDGPGSAEVSQPAGECPSLRPPPVMG